ncbi:MAG: hypothetical protein WA996_14585 [Candidatus Promineifilaceae bacterium]
MKSRRFVTGTSSERQPRPREPMLGAASLVLFGLIFGLVVGLYYAWLVEPVSYVAAGPSRLSDEYKDEYILLISQSYAADGDWEKARRRLENLDDPDVASTVALQLERYLRNGEPAQILNKLAIVAEKLGSRSSAVALFVPMQGEPVLTSQSQGRVSPTSTLLPTPTYTSRATRSAASSPTPTAKPSSTPVPVYRLLKQERVCRRNSPIPLIEVVLYDAFLEPIPGIEILVYWEGGSDHFFTGYHPENGLGYGDFTMEPELGYRVELADGSTAVDELQIENCGAEIGGLAGGWRLTYQNTDVQQGSSGP